MAYISIPLKPVRTPPPANVKRYRLLKVAVWAGYSAVIGGGMILLVNHLTAGLATGRMLILYAVIEFIVMVMSWVFMSLNFRDAEAKRWRSVAYPIYRERVTEIEGWSWDVRGAAVFDGKWRIVCLRHGSDGSDAYSYSAPQGRVTLLPGEEDSLVFGSIALSAADYPGYGDRILVGGDVTITFRSGRGGPPPLETKYQPDDSPA